MAGPTGDEDGYGDEADDDERGEEEKGVHKLLTFITTNDDTYVMVLLRCQAGGVRDGAGDRFHHPSHPDLPVGMCGVGV